MNNYQHFKSLHMESGGFFLGNVHDVLSAIILEKVGFKAIGTTSWGIANSLGYKDGERIDFADYLMIAKKIIDNVKIPVSIDIESGFSEETNQVVKNVLAVADIGAVGINIEDSLKKQVKLQTVERQGELLSKIRSKLDEHGFKDFFINARTDTYLQPCSNPVAETISRGKLYAAHGADGLFVPGLSDEQGISTIVREVSLPLNIMSLPHLTDFSALKKLNIKRFSFGNALSDFVIASIESVAKQLNENQNTAALYHHAPVETPFK